MLERLQKNGPTDEIRSRRRRPESRQESRPVLPLDLSLLEGPDGRFLGDPFASPVHALKKATEAPFSKVYNSEEQANKKENEESPQRPSYFQNVYISKEKGGKANSSMRHLA